MTSMLTSRKLISGLAVILLLVLCIPRLSVQARELTPHSVAPPAIEGVPLEEVSMNFAKIDLCYEQSLRLNLTYANDPTSSSQPASIRARVRLKDISGNTIYVSSANGGVWKTINAGRTWTFEVNRSQFPFIGAPGAGALSISPELIIEAPSGAITGLPCSLEIIDEVSGRVVLYDGDIVTREKPATEGAIYTVTFQGSLLSTMPGETFRVNLTNPLPLTLADQTVAGTDYLINIKGINGESIYTRKGMVKPGQTIVAEINRDQLQYSGASSAPRLGLVSEITYQLQLTADQFAALRQSPQFPISFELVDNLTGRTTTRAGKRFIIFVPTPSGTEGR